MLSYEGIFMRHSWIALGLMGIATSAFAHLPESGVYKGVLEEGKKRKEVKIQFNYSGKKIAAMNINPDQPVSANAPRLALEETKNGLGDSQQKVDAGPRAIELDLLSSAKTP